MSAISGRRGFIDLEADRDRGNRVDWAWSARPHRRPGDSVLWSPGWRAPVGSGWYADWYPIRAGAWQRRGAASADVQVWKYRRSERHCGKPGRRPWARSGECRERSGTTNWRDVRLASIGGAVRAV